MSAQLDDSRKPSILRVSVADNGVGIAPEHHVLMFKKFSRLPNKFSNSAVGSGLGLYWVDKVIRLHGGNVEFESSPGRGTTFHLLVPQERPNA